MDRSGRDATFRNVEAFQIVLVLVLSALVWLQARLVGLGQGGLVASIYTDSAQVTEEVVLGMAAYNGRVNVGSAKVADHSLGPGAVLPSLVHGGPGRAGGGEELGGMRGLQFYMQRTAIQGYKPLLEKLAQKGHRA